MYLSNDWNRFDHNGRAYAAKLEHDDCHGAPWGEEDGHGEVSDWTRRDKAPGEMVLSEDRGSKRFYDYAGACAKALVEGWDAPPYKTGTRREQAARAALADYNCLRRWCDGQWSYVGVIVAPVCDCCDEIQERAAVSLWGIESDAGDYLAEVARDLAEDLAATVAAAA